MLVLTPLLTLALLSLYSLHCYPTLKYPCTHSTVNPRSTIHVLTPLVLYEDGLQSVGVNVLLASGGQGSVKGQALLA
jgi:hypothetical protein